MRAKQLFAQAPSGSRTILAKSLPLDTPYMVQIFPAYACNFKCRYCVHCVPPAERGYITDSAFLLFDDYRKFIDDAAGFPAKIKMLRFAGTGEPLTHPDIVHMIQYAKEKGIAEQIDLVTNGYLLTDELSDALIAAGLSKLRVSIQGVNAERYKELSGVDIDYPRFIDRLKYFYDNKGKTEIYIKIIDCSLESEEERRQFYETFGDICDYIAIENMFPAVPQIDYTKMTKNDVVKTQNGAELLDAKVCPQPFYLMQLNPNGDVVPCCAMETPLVAGRIQTSSAAEIWSGQVLNAFRKLHLRYCKSENPVCRTCQEYRYAMFPEDFLDDEAERLLAVY